MIEAFFFCIGFAGGFAACAIFAINKDMDYEDHQSEVATGTTDTGGVGIDVSWDGSDCRPASLIGLVNKDQVR